MDIQALKELISDSELVANAAIRLGRLKTTEFLNDLAEAKRAIQEEQPNIDVFVKLQKTLNSAIVDIAPISLSDLKDKKWKPFQSKNPSRSWALIFGIFGITLMCLTAYSTELYNRASHVHTTLVELQSLRPSLYEQAFQLYDLAKQNEKKVIEHTKDKNSEFVIQSFDKAVYELQTLNEKYTAYLRLSLEITQDLKLFDRLIRLIKSQPTIFSEAFGNTNIGQTPFSEKSLENLPGPNFNIKKMTKNTLSPLEIIGSKDALLVAIYTRFTDAANLGFIVGAPGMSPQGPPPTSQSLYEIHDGLNSLGFWVLPALYGMLGAVVFYMRRFIDPLVPDPNWQRTVYRIALGGFAGIIAVWFWNPTSPKNGELINASLSSFGFAFLVGFSTDIFFQALDKAVVQVSKLIENIGR